MLQLKNAFCADSRPNAFRYMRLVIRRDIHVKPYAAGLRCIRNECLTFEVAHLNPVRAHPEHYIGTSACKSVKLFVFGVQCSVCDMTLKKFDRRPREQVN